MTDMAFSLVFIILALAWNCAVAVPTVPGIFVFGDSLADVGNNNYLNASTPKADFPFNGIDLPNGRFSNGYNTIDWLAKLLDYKQSPPASLSITDEAQMLHGVNFASGGSGILDTTMQGPTLTFTRQLEDFKSIVDAFVRQLGKKKATYVLSKSLFLISGGSNDIFDYYLTHGSSNATQNKQFIDSLVDKLSDHLKVLYEYEARKFALIGLSMIGCVPVLKSHTSTGKCIEDLNQLTMSFNIGAKAQMLRLEQMLEGMKHSYGNVYDLMILTREKPQAFGYKDIRNACCGSGKFNGEFPCMSNATVCSNRDQYLFWDQYHPTQAASKIIAMAMYSGSRRFASPINVMSLAKY